MKTIISHSLVETQKIAKEWLVEILAPTKKVDVAVADKPAAEDQAFKVGLTGHLGAGKTAFVKAVAKELGITETVTSPTFVIMKIYDIDQKVAKAVTTATTMVTANATVTGLVKTDNFNWKKLVHIDAYRFEKPEELKALNLEQLMADKDNLIMIEWPENVGLKLENNIKFKALEEGMIEIAFD